MNFLDFIFPKRCVSCGRLGSYICADCYRKVEFVNAPVCPVCQRQAVGGKVHPGCAKRFGLDGLVVACRYRGAIKIAIAKIKYRWVFDIAKVLVDILATNIWRFDIAQNYILVPVPLHARRKNWRGFNQAELMVEILAKKFGVSHADLLVRTVNTGTQVGLKREERTQNVRGAFVLSPNVGADKIRDRNFILVDDVYTSGATMAECAKVLKRAGAKTVWAMAVALG